MGYEIKINNELNEKLFRNQNNPNASMVPATNLLIPVQTNTLINSMQSSATSVAGNHILTPKNLETSDN
jgi:hypothetical protein